MCTALVASDVDELTLEQRHLLTMEHMGGRAMEVVDHGKDGMLQIQCPRVHMAMLMHFPHIDGCIV